MSQMREKLAEADVFRGNHSYYSTIARYTRQPSRSTDADLKRPGSFTPALFNRRRHFFRRILSLNVLFLARPQAANGRKRNHYEKKIKIPSSYSIIHD